MRTLALTALLSAPLALSEETLNLVAFFDTYPVDPYYRYVPDEDFKGYRYLCTDKKSIQMLMDCMSEIKDSKVVDTFGTKKPPFTVSQCHGKVARSANVALVNEYSDRNELPKLEYENLPQEFRKQLLLKVPYWEMSFSLRTRATNAIRGTELHCGVSIVRKDNTLAGFDWAYPDKYVVGEKTPSRNTLIVVQ